MKTITKLLLSATFLITGIGGANTAKAATSEADLSKFDSWNGTNISFSWTATYGNQYAPNLTDIGLPKGDLRGWEKLVIVVDELKNCDFFRVLVYNGDDPDHSNTFKVKSTGENVFTLKGNVDYLDKVTKIVLSGSNWEDSKNSTWSTTPASFKVSSVYMEKPDVVYIEASKMYEAPAGTTDVKDLEGTNTTWASTVTYPKEFAVQGQCFGNGDGSNESTHVNIDGYDWICFEVTSASPNTENYSAGLRIWIWDGSNVVTLYAKPIADYTTNKWTEASRITGTGTYVAKVSGYKYLKGVKANNDWGAPSSVVSMAYMCKGDVPVEYKDTGKYMLIGEAVGPGSLEDALADAKATSYDATGVINSGITLTPTNPNALFVAEEGVLSNTSNVIVNGHCANLVLTDGYPFKAPADFTATTASYTTTINTAAGAGTLCLPFDAEIPDGVTAWSLHYTGGDEATATQQQSISANKPVLLNGSGEVTFTGYKAAVSADAYNANGALIGVFEKTTINGDNLVLQMKDGETEPMFYQVETTFDIDPFRAYLKVEDAILSGNRLGIVYSGTVNGIQTIEQEAADSDIYDLQGRRVAKPNKGLYIIGGKKVIK